MKRKADSLLFVLLIVSLGLLFSAAGVDAASIDIHKSRDAHVTAFNTFFGFRFGDPIVDVDLPASNRLKASSTFPATDISVDQTFIDRVVVISFGAILPDPVNPGLFTMPELDSYLKTKVGHVRVPLPDLASDFFDVFVAVDLDLWINGGSPQPLPLESIVPIVDGASPTLPGVKVGLSEIMFDPAIGWDNPSPFTGDLFVLGDPGIAVPYPSTLLLLSLGFAAAVVGSRVRH